MGNYLYGIMSSSAPWEFGSIGFELCGGERGSVQACPAGAFSAVVGPVPPAMNGSGAERLDKETLIKLLLAHQQSLESVMKERFVLPCKFGTILHNAEEVSGVLHDGEALLSQWIRRLEDCLEVDVVATWDPLAILREIAETDPDILSLRGHSDAAAADQSQKMALGMMLSKKLQARRERDAAQILSALEGMSDGARVHDVLGDVMVVNASFLVKGTGRETFFQTVEDLDRRFENRLTFRCVGPLPPYSFATVEIKRFDADEIRTAELILGIAAPYDAEVVKRAYRKLARDCHPDARMGAQAGHRPCGGDDSEDFESLEESYRLLLAYCRGGCRPLSLSLAQAEGEAQ